MVGADPELNSKGDGVGEKDVNSSMQPMHVDQAGVEKGSGVVIVKDALGKVKVSPAKNSCKMYNKKPRQVVVEAANQSSPVKEGKKRGLDEEESVPMEGVKRSRVSEQVGEVAANTNMKAGLPEQSCKDQ